jgi:hypothetical protein
MTSSLPPTAATTSMMSSSAHGLFKLLIRTHKDVSAKSWARAASMNPERAATLASAGMASSRLPSSTSTWPIMSGTLARILSMWGGKKWIMRSSFTGTSRQGAGAPTASGR